ncbi:MAG: hypothetical protein GY801_08925 [bacterium]|nr:hypothetical protein [bacterium]
MKTRYEKIGIKQVIRLEWMDKTLDMLLAGMTADAIRAELKVYLSDKKQSGGTGERGEKTYTIAIGPLMQSWVEPEGVLLPLRDAVLDIARSMNFSQRIPLHWAMISAAYPFWFNVAKQVGRILNLQDQATQKQVVTRLKEQYGDRQTISRYARYAIRSFVAWGVLQDTERKGSYIKSASISIPDNSLASLLLEAALHTLPEGKGTLSMLLNTPGLFPFQLPDLTGKMTSQLNPRIEVSQTAGFDDRLLGLNNF